MEVCVFSSLFTVLCMGLYGKSTYAECTYPILSPPSLLVEYGDPAEVNCSIPNKPVTQYRLGWETKTPQPVTDRETSVVWKVDKLTEWEEVVGLGCYLTVGSVENQCMSNVTLTIYKKPDKITLRSVSDVWVEGHQTELRCEIENVGPGYNLSVRWSRADPKHGNNFTQFSETSFPDLKKEMRSVNKTANLAVTPSREDDGLQYQCAAVLNLDKDKVYTSEPINITVLYKPNIAQPLDEGLSIPEGESLMINCSADGNPSPHYKWTVRNNTIISNSSIIIISSVRKEDQGQYNCTAYNSLGGTTRTVTVTVIADNWTYSFTGWVLVAIITVLVCGVVCWVFYRHTRVCQYILTQLMSHRHNGHVGHKAGDQGL